MEDAREIRSKEMLLETKRLPEIAIKTVKTLTGVDLSLRNT